MNNHKERPTALEGRAVLIVDSNWEWIDDIDTDMIFHNAHLAITDPAQMGPHAFGNLPGWKDFPQRVQPGDILFLGHNFGAGSSRQQAVDCFQALGVAALVGQSFGAIYLRNAINAGFPILSAPRLRVSDLTDLEPVSLNFSSGAITRLKTGKVLSAQPMTEVQLEIYQSGGLLKLRRTGGSFCPPQRRNASIKEPGGTK